MKPKIDYLKASRNLLRFAFLTLLFVFLGTVVLFAQDSTTVAQVNGFISYIGKWPIAAKIATAIGLLSEVLSLIPDKYIPANGVVHAVILWIKAISWPKKP